MAKKNLQWEANRANGRIVCRNRRIIVREILFFLSCGFLKWQSVRIDAWDNYLFTVTVYKYRLTFWLTEALLFHFVFLVKPWSYYGAIR